jgi:predicted metalloprotease with PDZ domain
VQKISYVIHPVDPAGHLFEVTLTVAEPDPSGQVFSLPVWIPGSYMVREFSRNIVTLTAHAKSASKTRSVQMEKLDKHTWKAAPCKGALTLSYRVYAWDLSVRAAHLDAGHGFFNGSSVFLMVHGAEHLQQHVQIAPPAGITGWKVATSLPRAKGTRAGAFGTFVAPDYDALIDHPVEMGNFVQASFTACGARHEMVVTGKVPNLDMARLTADCAKICTAQIKLFEPETAAAPFLDSSDRYVFMTMALSDPAFGGASGGLEHRASTALTCSRNDLPVLGRPEQTEGYRGFLGLVSHEYFHTWNVKRIKPAAFVHYDLRQENYTPLLWLFEGFTSYYDDLMLVRSGVITEADYLKALARTIGNVMRGKGREKQTLAESSFDAWVKYYRQDENSPNAIVSYYAKGSLAALMLDLTIRTRTAGKRSLDDFMRLLWQRFGRDFFKGAPTGVEPGEIAGLLHEATGCDLSAELHLATESTTDLPLEKLLGQLGIAWVSRSESNRPSMGIRSRTNGSDCSIANCYEGEAAHRAGLSAGDVLVAINGLRVGANTLDNLLARHAPGDTVQVHAFRRDELIQAEVTLDAPGRHLVTLHATDKSPVAKLKLRREWLGQE